MTDPNGETVAPITDDERRRYLACTCCDLGSPWPCIECSLYLSRQRVAPAQGHRHSDLLLVALTLDEGHPEDELDAAQAVLDALVDAGWAADNGGSGQ